MSPQPPLEWKRTRHGKFHLVDPQTNRRIRLEPTSQEIADRLLACHPEWTRHAGYHEVEADGYLQRFLEVRVPSEHPEVDRPLLIRTYPNQIYLEWDGWHDEEMLSGTGEELGSILELALEIIEAWISDACIFVRVYEGDHLVQEWRYPVGEEPPEVATRGPGVRVVFRSWRGTHDRQIEPA